MEFLKGNAGKVGLVVVLLLVAVGLLLVRRERAPSRADKVHLVCVATGKTFWVDRRPMVLPLDNPETGEKTLLRCYEGEDGALYVDRSCRDLVKQLDEDKVNQYVDPKTLRVRSDP
jgi:hypothetical protein